MEKLKTLSTDNSFYSKGEQKNGIAAGSERSQIWCFFHLIREKTVHGIIMGISQQKRKTDDIRERTES